MRIIKRAWGCIFYEPVSSDSGSVYEMRYGGCFRGLDADTTKVLKNEEVFVAHKLMQFYAMNWDMAYQTGAPRRRRPTEDQASRKYRKEELFWTPEITCKGRGRKELRKPYRQWSMLDPISFRF